MGMLSSVIFFCSGGGRLTISSIDVIVELQINVRSERCHTDRSVLCTLTILPDIRISWGESPHFYTHIGAGQ